MSQDLLSEKSIKTQVENLVTSGDNECVTASPPHRAVPNQQQCCDLERLLIQTHFFGRRACTRTRTLGELSVMSSGVNCLLPDVGQEFQSVSVINICLFKPSTFKRVSFRDVGRTSCVVALCERSAGGGVME